MNKMVETVAKFKDNPEVLYSKFGDMEVPKPKWILELEEEEEQERLREEALLAKLEGNSNESANNDDLNSEETKELMEKDGPE